MGGRILIVDDVATNRIVFKAKLAAACYETLLAPDGTSALSLARSALPDLILLDMVLPDIDGAEVCARLRANPATRDIPVIVTTASTDTANKIRALEAGADDYLSKPVNEGVLFARLRNLLRAREAEAELQLRNSTCRELGFADAPAAYEPPARVAIVAARTSAAVSWRAGVAPRLSGSIEVMPPATALAVSRSPDSAGHDAFVIAAEPGTAGDGLQLISELRSRAATRHSAICIVLPEGASHLAAMALDLGASDLMIAPVDPCEMALRLRTLLRRKRLSDRLRASVRDGLRLAVTDPLTGLYNRRYALPHLTQIAERARQSGRSFAVMVLDLDHFKSINDTHGHAAGDAVLVAVAERLRDNLRACDLIARIGGEEFLVAMPDIGLKTAHVTAERLCRKVEDRPVPLPGGSAQRVTMSIGLAASNPMQDFPGGEGGIDIHALIGRADRALMGAKAEGRNQVTVSLPTA